MARLTNAILFRFLIVQQENNRSLSYGSVSSSYSFTTNAYEMFSFMPCEYYKAELDFGPFWGCLFPIA